MIEQLKHYRANFHILSPIHIGTGQELDPFSYVIKNNTLLLVDLVKWMESYSEKDEIERLMESDNFAIVRSLIAEKFDNPEAVLCDIPIDNPKLIESYQTAIREKNPRNQVLINPMIRNEISQEAYIPGSSIKGAIRTAIANEFVKSAKVTAKDAYRSGYETKIFGRIKEDPMKLLKLSDVSLGKRNTVIVEAKEYPLNQNKALTPKGHMEVSISECHVGKPTVFPMRLNMAAFKLHGKTVDLPFLIDSLYCFYVPKYEEEYSKFYKTQISSDIEQAIDPMNKAVSELKTNEALMRLGHFSHVECMTLDEVRNPKTRLGKNKKPLPWGKTRTLANGIYPFGWVKIEFLDIESKQRPLKKWPFPIDGIGSGGKKSSFDKVSVSDMFIGKSDTTSIGFEKPPVSKPVERPLERLINEMKLVKPNAMGPLGTIIQKIESLETNEEKAEMAKAFRNHIGAKAFRKHKQREYLLKLMKKEKSTKGP